MTTTKREKRKVVCARIGPNEDLVTSIEKICKLENIDFALVRGNLGSLTSANLISSNLKLKQLDGPAVEVLSLHGHVDTELTKGLSVDLYGIVSDERGKIIAGKFVAGCNNVCVTMEIVIESWDSAIENINGVRE